jgi:hypothetical protein
MRDRGRRGGERFNDNRSKRPIRPMGGGNFKGGRNETREPEPSAKEKPCRTLFVRNVQYDTLESDVKALFDKYGEVKDVFNLIQSRGMIFVTFYDVRAAEEAKRAMQDIYLKDRKIDVHYSLPKEEEEKAKCDRTKNQGTLLYTLKNSSIELDDNELHKYFSRFGEVKAIRVPHFKKSTAHHYTPSERNQQRLVEFYDSRACVDAFDATYDTEYNGGKWDVAFFWDHPYKDRQNSHLKRERNFEREEDRGRRRNDQNRGYDYYNGRDDRHYAPPPPSGPMMGQNYGDPRLQNNPEPMYQAPVISAADNQRLEQAQKAQQILSMLTQQQQQQPQAPSLTSPFQPNNIQSPPVQQHASSFVQPVPPTETQNNQLQQLLGLLGQAAAQQQQHQPPQQQAYQQSPIQQQQAYQPSPVQQQPTSVAPIPGMDPATALTQLAALLQQQQQNQNQ